MLCEHLRELETELKRAGIIETFRGQAWSHNCREWVYFDCHLDLPAIRARMSLAPCVADHANTDPHSGTERGLVCTEHHDAIMGSLEPQSGKRTFE
jgi:hypothetical protein